MFRERIVDHVMENQTAVVTTAEPFDRWRSSHAAQPARKIGQRSKIRRREDTASAVQRDRQGPICHGWRDVSLWCFSRRADGESQECGGSFFRWQSP